MALLDAYLDQIQLCSSTIAQLPFPPPKIFTNAMLHATDITSLIRDTEAHERALFSLAPEEETNNRRRTAVATQRGATAFANQQDETDINRTFRGPRKGTAVATVLGGDLSERIRREYQRDASESRRDRRQQRDDFDVELLLTGAQRLCSVYPIPGALERIALLRNRNAKVTASLEKYEGLVAEQSAQLSRINGVSTTTLDEQADEEFVANNTHQVTNDDLPMTEDDIRQEEEGIAELERRKRTLEERVSGIEKDLGGLMR